MILLVNALNAILNIILNKIIVNAWKSLVRVLLINILLAIGNVLHAEQILFSQFKVIQDVQDVSSYCYIKISNEY